VRIPRTACCLVIFPWIGVATAADSLRTTDTLYSIHTDTLLSLDTAQVLNDSLPVHHGAVEGWALPLALIAVMMTAIWLLFSTRSR
jgi:hypothetical protein